MCLTHRCLNVNFPCSTEVPGSTSIRCEPCSGCTWLIRSLVPKIWVLTCPQNCKMMMGPEEICDGHGRTTRQHFRNFTGRILCPQFMGGFFLVNEEPKSSGWNNVSTITFEAPFGSNYIPPETERKSLEKGSRFKRTYHLPTIKFHQISGMLVFREVIFSKQNIQPYWCHFLQPLILPTVYLSFKGSGPGTFLKAERRQTFEGLLNQKVGVFDTFTLLLCSALICLFKTSHPGKDDPILPAFVSFFSCQQWEIDWSSKHQPPI